MKMMKFKIEWKYNSYTNFFLGLGIVISKEIIGIIISNLFIGFEKDN
jgi:hypothetical protein